jgi:hypothetical protein
VVERTRGAIVTENASPEAPRHTVDQERGKFGSAGWDATDDDPADETLDDDDRSTGLVGEITEPVGDDVPRPDPDQDQG